MREEADVTTTVAADPATCFEVAAAVAEYPHWAADIKHAQIDEHDDEGRPHLVTFRAAAMGRSTSYTLRYDYSGAPERLSWAQVSGDVTEVLDGTYVFTPTEDGGTEIAYHLVVQLTVPLPGFVKRRAEGRIIHTALSDFTARVEALASA